VAAVVCCFFVLIFLLTNIPEFKQFAAPGSKDPFAFLYIIFLGIRIGFLLIPLVLLAFGLHLFFEKLYQNDQSDKLYYFAILPLVIIGTLVSAFNLEKINAVRIMTGSDSARIAAITQNWAVVYDYKIIRWMGEFTSPLIYWAAINEATPSSVLGDFSLLNINSINKELARNTNTPDYVLANLAARDDQYSEIISRNYSASANTLRILYKYESRSWYTIKNLWNNPATPKDIRDDIQRKFSKEKLDLILNIKDKSSYN